MNRNIKLLENVLRENGGSAVKPGRTLGRNEKMRKEPCFFSNKTKYFVLQGLKDVKC
jgi:hypothetical protein